MRGADLVHTQADPQTKEGASEIRAPSKETVEAIEEAERGGLPAFDDVESLLADLKRG